MLHLRVITPHDRVDEVVAMLRGQVGVAHLVVFPGAAVKPDGDVVEADLARECADDTLSRLTELGVDRDGGITLEALETTLSDAADSAKGAAPGDGDDAVVWDEVISRTANDSRINGVYLAFLTLGLLIAAIGVVSDSPVTVVGAMAVAPDFGPLAALSVGLVLRRWDLVRQSSMAAVFGFAFAMAVTAVVVLVLEWTRLITIDAPGLGADSQVDFIYEVGPFSLIVALLAGAAGMLSVLSARSTALIGVFISVTTVPAAAYAVVAATLGDWSRFGQSVVQLLVNLVGIVIAATVVLAVRAAYARRKGRLFAGGRPLSSG
ncbi:DUF389 domain-containing protein [Allonocardiopsis opalescens]|uniref:Putative hydrophobic protein (TIGR00271 family) n=1 Tax=Allonocardiopsis opalescens TaxID=1144618 RepID=A0A2T0PX97_9ACTN|nr:DUF389 domain-containing protein [Allonocardiopsis opalescens]PRX96164.1 putative hydrophobic protein (TIGR00271 family) [Allonocardiopsis opalescens]